jgi:ribosome-associated protein
MIIFTFIKILPVEQIITEIEYQTTRSGGKGGQNVNKVETAVIAYFNIAGSASLTEEQKQLVQEKLAHRINKEGQLIVRSQSHRTQLANKKDAAEKIIDLITSALHRKKLRIASKPSKRSKEKRLEHKKIAGEKKSARKKFRPKDF